MPETLVLSLNSFFKIGMGEIIKNLFSLEDNGRIVFFDVTFSGFDSNYLPLENDTVLYITPKNYPAPLRYLFINTIHRGRFITANPDINKFACSLINAITVTSAISYSTRLTPMEIMVLRTLIDKCTYYQSARILNINRKTVSAHKLNAMEKLGIKNFLHIILLFKKLGLSASTGFI